LFLGASPHSSIMEVGMVLNIAHQVVRTARSRVEL
jgi:hypothetical protein